MAHICMSTYTLQSNDNLSMAHAQPEIQVNTTGIRLALRLELQNPALHWIPCSSHLKAVFESKREIGLFLNYGHGTE